MNFWFTSDTHFGHENIIAYSKRPFANVKEMNEALLDYWNESIKPGDCVYHLGDVAMGHFDDSWEYVKKLNGTIYLILGNHDRVAARYGMSTKYLMKYASRYEEKFAGIEYEGQLLLDCKQHVKIHHFPYDGDHTDEIRFKDQRPVDDGYILIHGHVHEQWKINGRQHNVGVDVRGFKPVSREEIIEEINQQASRL